MISKESLLVSIVNNDCLAESDAIVLLEGDGFNRVRAAAELYASGFAKKVVFSGGADDKAYGSYPFCELKSSMLAAGIDGRAVIHESRSRNTREQAIEVMRLAEEHGWDRLILVASPDHQCRAYLTFLRVLLDERPATLLYNVPARGLPWFVDEGWGTRIDRIAAEFDRIGRYSAMGHLASIEEAIVYQREKEARTYGHA